MAKAALENALWVIEAQQKAIPLAKAIGGTLEEIPCGVSIGIQNSVEELLEKIAREVSAGYQRIKVKVKPGWDINVLERIRTEFPRIALMADANSAYTLSDLAHLKQFDRFYLMMIEQPLGWDDIIDHAKLQREISTPICLDESIHSADDARKAIEIGACKIINVKRPCGGLNVGQTSSGCVPGKEHSGLVRRDARVRNRAGSQYCHVLAARVHPSGRRFCQQAILDGGYHRPGGDRNRARNHSRPSVARSGI
jgi:o-succinylbenzoate synthase